MGEAELEPWFKRIEERLAIAPWPVAPNENNDILRRGCEKLGFASGMIQRNVKGCANLGYCGMGCPTNAKQSMLVTTIPAALDRGATLVQRAQVDRLVIARDRVTACEAHGIAGNGASPIRTRVRVRARHFILAAGAIGSPGILLRSAAPDPHLTLGKRTFLHPTVVSAAVMPQRVDGHAGAPQTIYSDHFLDSMPLDGPAGFKLESAPTHPVLVGITLPGFGDEHARWMEKFPQTQVVIALMRDGSPAVAGGTRRPARIARRPRYEWSRSREGVRRAYLTMAEIQFAAGPRR